MRRYILLGLFTLLSAGALNAQSADSLSRFYHRQSVEAYGRGDWRAAIAAAERALGLQRELFADTLGLPLGKSLANLGLFHRNLGHFSQALPYLLEADRVFGRFGHWRRRHNNREQLVYLYQATGELGSAGRLLDLMTDALPAPSSEAVVLARAETERLRGVQAVQQKQYAAAAPHLAAAAVGFDSVGSLIGALETGMESARAEFYLGDYEASVRQVVSLLPLVEEYELHYDAAVLYNQRLLSELRRGDRPAAERAYDKGRTHAVRAENPRALAVLELSRAELALAAEDGAGLRRYGNEALATLAPGWTYSEETPVPGRNRLAASPHKVDLFETLRDYAQLLTTYADQTGAAPAAYERARVVVAAADLTADLLRADLTDEVSKLFWREDALPLYVLGVRLAAMGGNEAEIFYYLEKSRGLLLLDELRTSAVLATVPPELGELVRARQDSLALLLARQLKGAKVPEEREAVREARLALREIRDVVADRVPALRKVVTQPEIASLERARANLLAGGWDRQLQYLTTPERIYVFVLTADTAYLQPLVTRAEVKPALRNYLSFYRDRTRIEEGPAEFLSAAYEVYRLLLEPLALPAAERLLILPDAELGYLPFAALVTAPGATALGSAPYLLRRHPVSYAISSSTLDLQTRRAGGAGGAALAFAPFTTDFPGRREQVLTASPREVAALSRLYRADRRTGSAATRADLLARLPEVRLAHLSTHAFPDQEDRPPRILTADEPIYLSDVYGLDLDAELVGLSACQSNIGRVARGEGVLGMGRAFTAAGARGVLASLWNLNDNATADLVTDFYGELAAGATKPTALHAAQLAYLERTDLPDYLKSPYYWAGLTYYGTGEPLRPPGAHRSWWIGLGVIVLVFLGGLIYQRRQPQA